MRGSVDIAIHVWDWAIGCASFSVKFMKSTMDRPIKMDVKSASSSIIRWTTWRSCNRLCTLIRLDGGDTSSGTDPTPPVQPNAIGRCHLVRSRRRFSDATGKHPRALLFRCTTFHTLHLIRTNRCTITIRVTFTTCSNRLYPSNPSWIDICRRSGGAATFPPPTYRISTITTTLTNPH